MLHLKSNEKLSEASQHEWMNHFENLLNRKDLGFFDLAHLQKLHVITRSRVQAIQSQSDVLAVVGIGGSSLGGRVISEAFGVGPGNRRLLFFDNVDPIEFSRLIEQCSDLRRVHWLFISKSGSTIETLAVLDQVDTLYTNEGLNLAAQCTVITEQRENPLNSWASKNKVASLEIPLNVGGRFSVLTPVGLFPAEFIGASGESILAGANKALKDPQTICTFAHEVFKSFGRNEWITVFLVLQFITAQYGIVVRAALG